MAARWTIPNRLRAIEGACVVACFVVGLGYIWSLGYGWTNRGWLAAAAMVVAALAVMGIAWLWGRRWRRRIGAMEWFACLHCAHDLRGIGERGVCPECGQPFTLEQTRETWKESLGVKPKRRPGA